MELAQDERTGSWRGARSPVTSGQSRPASKNLQERWRRHGGEGRPKLEKGHASLHAKMRRGLEDHVRPLGEVLEQYEEDASKAR